MPRHTRLIMAIRIGSVTLTTDRTGSSRVSARVEGAGLDTDVWFTSPTLLSPSAESFLVATLLPAMALGEDIVIDGGVSPLLSRNLMRLQDAMAAWHHHLRPVAIRSGTAAPVRHAGGGRMAFFSGGVDSFATIHQHRDELTHLVLVRGFDIPLANVALWDEVRRRLSDAASDLGLPLVIVETNVREVLDRGGDWGLVGHGAGLASVGLLLQRAADTVYIPSTHRLSDMFPWGSHPLIDPLWSTETLQFVHDGAHLTRVQKTALIAGSEAAMRHLRVCYRNAGGDYNCGRCEKCLRTMIGLALAGALDRCATFRGELDPARLRHMWLSDENAASFARENLERARQVANPQLARALEYALWSYEARQTVRQLRELTRRVPLRALARRCVRARA